LPPYLVNFNPRPRLFNVVAEHVCDNLRVGEINDTLNAEGKRRCNSQRYGFGSIWITDYKNGLLSRIAIEELLTQ
jgi:hypothetical protein